MPKISLSEVIEELDHVDDADVLDRVGGSTALNIALSMVRPRNWWGAGVGSDSLFEIARIDGIPIVWVPRSDILAEMANARDRDERVSILVSREDLVLQDCEAVLEECTDPLLADELALARDALHAHQDGHIRAAMALAVVLGESLAIWSSIPPVESFDSQTQMEAWQNLNSKEKSAYKWAGMELTAVGLDTKKMEFKRRALLAPIPSFFTPWYPWYKGGAASPPPEALSRHVELHSPTARRFNRANSILALMLISSLLREQQEWCHRVNELEYENFD